MTQHPALPATIKPTSKGDTAHVNWGTLGPARRRLGELRGEPRHAAARSPGRTPSATLTRAVSGVKRRSCTLRLMDGLGAAGQQLSARTGRRRRPQPRRRTCTRAHSVVMSAHATCSGRGTVWPMRVTMCGVGSVQKEQREQRVCGLRCVGSAARRLIEHAGLAGGLAGLRAARA